MTHEIMTNKHTVRFAISLKPVLNWTDFCFTNLVRGVWWTWKKFGKLSSFITGWTFTSPTWFRQFNGLWRSCVWGPKVFAVHALGTVHWDWWILCLIGWNLRALLWMRKTLGQQNMDGSVNVSSCFRGNGLICVLVGGVVLSAGPSRHRLQKWGSTWQSCGIHCWSFMDDRQVLTLSSIAFM